MSQRILFYRQNDPYGEFSNFYPAPIEVRGQVWPTSEHFFQAMKFEGNEYTETIRTAPSPGQAAKLGRSRSHPLRSDWEDVKYGIMKEALIAKFTQHPNLRSVLLGTGDAELVEHTRNDSTWADGGDGSGRNLLGLLLMEVRQELGAEGRS